MPAPRALLLASTLVVAGCLADDAPPGADDDASSWPVPRFDAPALDHDHAGPSLHGRAQGLALVGHLPLAQMLDDGELARAADVQAFGALAVVVLNGGDGGFVTVDLGDPSRPAVLGRYRSGSSDDWYAAFTPDGTRVLLTANECGSPTCLLDPAPTQPAMPAATTGLHLVDVTDPTRPRLAAVWPHAGRIIDVAAVDHDGETLVFAAENHAIWAGPVTGAGALPSPEAVPNSVAILRLDEGPDGLGFSPVGRFVPEPPPTPAGRVIVHDLAVAVHPVTGALLLYAAYWDAGAFIVDVTDPARPVELSRIRHEPFSEPFRVHTIKPDDGLVGGRHLTLTSPETFGGSASGALVVLDTTDPAAPRELAVWSLPGELTNTEPLLWSPHEFSIHAGRAYTSHFHAGVVVLDLTPAPDGASPRVVAFAEPVAPADAPQVPEAIRWTPDTETVLLHEGLLYVTDMGTGLYVFAPA